MTRFECQSLAAILILRGLHIVVKRAALRKIPECLGVTTSIDWRSRTMYSISIWRDMKDLCKMGEAQKHVLAARVPGRLGVHAYAGIFTYVGDWRRVLFNSKYSGSSSITGWAQDAVQEPVQGEK